jgi:hypothetical protein
VSKRTRGAKRTPARRPGQRGRLDARRPAAPAPLTRTAIDAVPEEAMSPAEATQPVANVMRGSRVRPNSLLAARGAEEYVYVAQDLRRIAVVAVLLFGLLFSAWIVLELLGIPGK